jgi:hypothetical protein
VYAFAIGLAATYLILGVLVAVAVRLSESAFGHMPGWGIPLVYLGVGGLCAFMLAIGNVLAIMGALTVALGLTVLVVIRTLPRVVPVVADALLRPFRRRVVGERGTRSGPR